MNQYCELLKVINVCSQMAFTYIRFRVLQREHAFVTTAITVKFINGQISSSCSLDFILIIIITIIVHQDHKVLSIHLLTPGDIQPNPIFNTTVLNPSIFCHCLHFLSYFVFFVCLPFLPLRKLVGSLFQSSTWPHLANIKKTHPAHFQ